MVAAARSAVVDLRVAGDSAPEQHAWHAGEVARLVGDTRLLRRVVGVDLVGQCALDRRAERADEGAALSGMARTDHHLESTSTCVVLRERCVAVKCGGART